MSSNIIPSLYPTQFSSVLWKEHKNFKIEVTFFLCFILSTFSIFSTNAKNVGPHGREKEKIKGESCQHVDSYIFLSFFRSRRTLPCNVAMRNGGYVFFISHYLTTLPFLHPTSKQKLIHSFACCWLEWSAPKNRDRNQSLFFPSF